MDIGTVLDFVLRAGFWAGVMMVLLALLPRVLEFLVLRDRHRTAVAPWPAVPPSLSLTLLVRVDEESGLLLPSVQLQGSPIRLPAQIKLELVDRRGVVRHSSARRLSFGTIGTELQLAVIAPPDGSSVHDVLGWHWDVVIEEGACERARWREHPTSFGSLNAEAEIDMPSTLTMARG